MTRPGIFIHVQHLSGVGHTVRMQRLGQALAAGCDVTILDGGRALPFPAPLQALCVPRLGRIGGKLQSLDASLTLDEALARRAAAIRDHLENSAPEAVVVEHYPFSKWELEEEILGLVQSAKRANPAAKVIASLRDISPATRYEQVNDYAQRVLERLHKHFDALLVHADPGLCTLEQSFPRAGDIRIPVHHTGIVTAPGRTLDTEPSGNGQYVVASIGGGRDRAGLAQRVINAWSELHAAGTAGNMRLLLFGGLDEGDSGVGKDHTSDTIIPMGFSGEFRRYLSGAALSVSCAGYNTCADLLTSGTPALLLPNTAMSDQLMRAQLLDRCGAATLVPEPDGGVDPLAQLMARALEEPAAQCANRLDLDGAARSARTIEALVSAGNPRAGTN